MKKYLSKNHGPGYCSHRLHCDHFFNGTVSLPKQYPNTVGSVFILSNMENAA